MVLLNTVGHEKLWVLATTDYYVMKYATVISIYNSLLHKLTLCIFGY